MSRLFAFTLLLLLSACQFNTPQPTALSMLPIQIIHFWQPVSGTLNAHEIQPWDFIGQAGDAVRVRVISPAAVSLTLQTAEGVTLVQGENQIEATLPADGIYGILVQAEELTQYELGLSYTDRPNPADATPTPLPVIVAVPTPTPPFYAHLGTLIGALQSGQALSGLFDVPEERHVYTFTASANDYISLQMVRQSDSLDPIISLYAPSGAEVASDDNSGGNHAAALRNIRLPENGIYTIQAWGRGLTGSYQISMVNSRQPIPITPIFVYQPSATPFSEILTPTTAAALNGQTLLDHVPVSGKLERSGDVAHYSIQGAAGQTITIAVNPAPRSKLIPHIDLYDPNGALLTSASASEPQSTGDALIPAVITAETGIYQIFISGEKRTSGSYTAAYGIGFSQEDVRHGLAPADQNINGGLARRGLRDVWSLDLNQDDVITAAVSALTPALDPLLELVAPDGSLVAMDDNGGGGTDALIVSARAPVPGRYHLQITGANASGTGGYTLVWHYINLAPTSTPAPGRITLLSFTDSIPGQAYQFYPFYGQAGTTVEIRVIGQPGSSLDPVAALIAPDGNVIAQGDDSESDLNPRFTVTLPVDGTYQVRVNGYLSSGIFDLTVDALYPPG